MELALAIVMGAGAGVVAGLLGVGGGLLFVPALVLGLGLGQIDAEATSLLAIVPVALVGAARQRRYGNVRLPDALALGVLAVGGVVAGNAIATSVPQGALRIAFACLLFVTAGQLAWRALRRPGDGERRGGEGPSDAMHRD